MKRIIQIPFHFGGFDNSKVVIINDLVVGGLDTSNVGLYHFKSFHLLHQLLNCNDIKGVIPSKLVPYVKDNLKFHKSNSNSLFLIDSDDYSISAEIIINENSKFPVSMKKIKVNSISVNQHIKLAALSAFMLFANLCANSCSNNFAEMMRIGFIHNFDGSKIEQEILQRKPLVDENPLNYNVYWYYVELFSANYIQYLKNQMEKGEFHPIDILKLSGAPTLALLIDDKIVSDFADEILNELFDHRNLSLNRQIMYLSFIGSIRDWSRYNYILEDVLNEHKSQFKKLKETVLKNVPKIERIKKYRH